MALNQPPIKKLPHNPLASTRIYNYKHRQTQLWQQIIEFQIIVKPIFTIIIYRQGHTIVLKTCAKHVLLYMSAEYAAAKCIQNIFYIIHVWYMHNRHYTHTHTHIQVHVHYQLGVYIQGGINLFLPHHSPSCSSRY